MGNDRGGSCDEVDRDLMDLCFGGGPAQLFEDGGGEGDIGGGTEVAAEVDQGAGLY